MRLVLLGAPGSGKGTQGDILARHFGVPHISSGELLRANVDADTELGRQIAAHLARGDLVPDDLVLAIVADAILRGAETGGYVLDGFPRTLEQAERAYELALPTGVAADAVVYLMLPDDVARRRLVDRAAAGRNDDTDNAAVERRLEVFHENTQPLLDFYGQRNILLTVDATQSIEDVSKAIFDGIEALTTHEQ